MERQAAQIQAAMTVSMMKAAAPRRKTLPCGPGSSSRTIPANTASASVPKVAVQASVRAASRWSANQAATAAGESEAVGGEPSAIAPTR